MWGNNWKDFQSSRLPSNYHDIISRTRALNVISSFIHKVLVCMIRFVEWLRFSLFQAKTVFKDYRTGVMENGGKLVVLMHIIEESLKLGEKVLVFRWDSLPTCCSLTVVLVAYHIDDTIDHFTVLCLVAWPLNESEAGVDLVLIETSLLFICKFLLISTRTASLTLEKEGGFYQNKVTSSLTFIQRPGN